MAPRAFESYTLAARNSVTLQPMVWSLSKDDDGLDSVLPLADSVPAPSGGVPRRVHVTSAPAAPPRPAETSPHGSSSIVVDPISQIPEPLETRARKGVEPTQILKGRRLDALRAEVAQRRRAHRRRQQRTLLLWAVAGAGALCLGWLAGQAFTPSGAASPEGEAAMAPAAMAPAQAIEPAPSSTNAKPTAPDAAPTLAAQSEEDETEPKEPQTGDGSVVSLEDLPLAEDAEDAPEPSNRPPSDEGGTTLSLDDLPPD